MSTVTINFSFSDDSDDSNEFEVSSGLLDEITEYAEEMAKAKSEDSGDEVSCEKWEVFETELEYTEQRDHDDFDDLDDWAEYCDLVDEHGEAFVLRNNDWNGHEDLKDYNGCWASEEEFVRDLYESCYEIPDFLQFYIDWEKVARDAMMDYSSYEGDDGYHIFRD
jgi:antirestriction protein